MTVYKYFLKSALKQKWIILAYAGIFFLLSIISLPGEDKSKVTFIQKSLDIAIVDKSKSELSGSLIDYLDSNNYVTTDEEDIERLTELLFLEVLEAVVIIPRDFEEKVIERGEAIELIRDERRMESFQVANEINKFLSFANATYTKERFDSKKVADVLKEEANVEILAQDNYKRNNGVNAWFKNYFNFTGYVIIAIYVSVIGLVMLEFNDKNIEDRMKVSSKKFLKFNSEIYLGQVTLAIIITAMFIFGSILVKGSAIPEVQFLKYIVNIFVFSFSILGFTFLVNNVTRSRFIISAISTVASLGTALISGIMVSQEFLGENVVRIARFFPTYYFVRANEANISSFWDIRYELLIQVLFGVSFILMGLYFSKVKRNA